MQFVKRLEGVLQIKIAEVTERVMHGQLGHEQYIRLTAQTDALSWAINQARELLRKDDEEDEGESDGVFAGGGHPRR